MKLIIRPISGENREAAEKLRVREDQKHYIETVSECMEEADRLSLWEPVGIYAGSELAGFAMYGRFREKSCDRLWFDRFLIDRNFQGRGLGTEAVSRMLCRMWEEYPGMDIYLSVYEDNEPAIRLYRSYGFRFNGELDINGEKVMVLPWNERQTGRQNGG